MVGRRVHAAAKVNGRDADGDPVLAVVDATAVGQDVDVGAFGPELAVSLEPANSTRQSSVTRRTRRCRKPSIATKVAESWDRVEPLYLCEILADGLGGMTEVVAEGTGIAGLTRALSEELARDV